MQTQSTFRKYMALISLGFMGGTIYMSQYIGSTFYTQLLDTLNMTNTQYGVAGSIGSVFYLIIAIPGAILADIWEAKKTIVISVGGISILSLTFPLWVHGFITYVIFQILCMVVMIAYWGCLIKYINNLGGEDEAGNSFGMYYLINGLSGAIGSAIPLWVGSMFDNNIGVIVFVEGVVTTIATILVVLFLDDEKKLAARGIHLKGDEPMQLKHLAAVLKWPGTYMMFFAYMSTIALYNYISYLTPYLTDICMMDENLSSALAIIRQYGVNLVAPIGGYMADKVLKATYKWYIMAFAIIAVLFAVLALFIKPTANIWFVSVYTVLIAAMCMMLYTVTWSIIRELHVPKMVEATLVGIASMSESVMGMFLPVIIGNILDKNPNASGYNTVFLILAFICVLGILNAMWVGSHHKKCVAGKRSFEKSTGFNANAEPENKELMAYADSLWDFYAPPVLDKEDAKYDLDPEKAAIIQELVDKYAL